MAQNLSLLPVDLMKTDGATMIPSYLGSWMNWRRYYTKDGQVFKGLIELLDGCPIDRQTFISKVAERNHRSNGNCPICDGRGTIEWDQYGSNRNWCFCTLIDWFIQRKDINTRLESPWNEKNLANFLIKPQREGKKKLEYMLGMTDRFIADPCEHWLIMAGGTGAGKSFMIESIRTELGDIALYIACQDINTIVHSSLKDRTLDDVISVLSNAPILLLDDYGAQYAGSQFTQSVVASVLDHRYRQANLFPTVIATNLNSDDLRGLDARTASRMLDVRNSILVDVEGVSDFRSLR